MRIAIFGCGGVGGYFGGRLAQANQDVIFIARGEQQSAMQRNGLQVDSIAGDFKLNRVRVTDDPKSIGIVDYVICGVKALHIPSAATAMQPMVGDNTLVIPLQNGVEAPARLADVLGEDKVLGGLCAIISFLAAPGHIKHIGANPLIRFGHMDKRADTRVNALSEVFNQCHGVKSSIPNDIRVAMWQKFMLITAWSGIGAITRAPIGILLQLKESKQMLLDALEEIYQVGLAHQIELPADSVATTMGILKSFPENSTTSMQRDIDSGLPSELDVQNDAVVRLAREVGLSTPINQFILDGLRPTELRARGALNF